MIEALAVVAVVLAVVFGWSLVRVGARADRRAAELYAQLENHRPQPHLELAPSPAATDPAPVVELLEFARHVVEQIPSDRRRRIERARLEQITDQIPSANRMG